MYKLKLVEVFNTYQGEGIDAGRQMTIVRFRECDRVMNAKACPFCDTMIKMRISAEAEYDFEIINNMVKKTGGLMITGGEPGYSNNLEVTKILLSECCWDIVNIETNGCNINELISFINELEKNHSYDISKTIRVMYSPKFFNSDEVRDEIIKTKEIINDPHLYIKVVDTGDELIKEYLHEIVLLSKRKDQIWVMPEGTNRDNLIKNSSHTMDIIEEYGVNFSSRNHIIFGFV